LEGIYVIPNISERMPRGISRRCGYITSRPQRSIGYIDRKSRGRIVCNSRPAVAHQIIRASIRNPGLSHINIAASNDNRGTGRDGGYADFVVAAYGNYG